MSAARLDKSARRKSWIAQAIVAIILAVAVPGKFTGDPMAVAIFEQLGAEPAGRVAAGIFEALAVVLVLIPATAVFGGLLALGLMTGAILSHLTVIGISVDGDPSLFLMATVAFLASLAVVGLRRRQIPFVSSALGTAPAADAGSR